jgi:ABC-type Mn2+/Zn2+ transport system ATPase subunit
VIDAPMIELAGVTCAYRSEPVVTGIDLTVGDGAFTGIVGPSGSGKTTILRAMLGVVQPVSGTVRRRPGLRVGYVPQVETVDWSFPVTVSECVSMARIGRRRAPWRSAAERAEADAVLERLGLAGFGSRHIRELSGGQQQRVFIARALLGEPDVLLMDEPTSGVDVATRHELLHLLHHLNDSGVAIVLTTHDLNGIATHLPHLVCVNNRVVAAGHPCDILTPGVLELTYGARMDVLIHGGMPVVIDHAGTHHHGHARGEARALA